MKPSRDLDLDIDYSERSGFLTGKAAALAEWRHKKDKVENEKLFACLRTRRWQKANPERVRENNKKADRKRYARRRDERAWLIRGHVLTCARCATQWCRVPCRYMGPEPKYCRNGCLKKAMHERAMADETRRRKAVERAVAWQKANRERKRDYNREWQRARRAKVHA